MTTGSGASASTRKAELLADAEGISRQFNQARDKLIQLAGLESELAAARGALEAVRAETGKLREEAQTLRGPLQTLREMKAALAG